jgi:hypothetical protein
MGLPYGFRVYVVEAYPNSIKGKEPLSAGASSSLRMELLDILDTLHGQGTRFLQPTQSRIEGLPEKPVATLTVGEPNYVREDLVALYVGSGETGSHPVATRRGAEPQDLREASPEVHYQMALVFPRIEDNRFFIVAQTYRRRDPLSRLLRLVKEESYKQRERRRQEETERRLEFEARGERPPKREVHSRLLFTVRQATDNSYINEIMQSAKSATATFARTIPSSRGARARTVERQLTINLMDQERRVLGRGVGQHWMDRSRQGDPVDKRGGVAELAIALDEEQFVSQVAGDEAFDEASITVRSGEDTTRIAVDTLRDVFTYPVADGLPSAFFHYTKVAPRLHTLALEEGIAITDINASEMHEWLDDLTSAPSSEG